MGCKDSLSTEGTALGYTVIAIVLLALTIPSISKSTELRPTRAPLSGLRTAQTILLETTPSRGSNHLTKIRHIQRIFSERMKELGYTTVTDNTHGYDVLVQLDCTDQNIPPKKTINTGKDDIHTIPTYLGPPCVIRYQLNGQTIPWQRIERIVYAEGANIAKELTIDTEKHRRLSRIVVYLERYDFPLLLAAEWGHIDRLIRIFHRTGTSQTRQQFVIWLLGEIHATQAFSFLVERLKEDRLVTVAARALGNFGERARKHLDKLLQTSPRSEVQAAAAYGLGKLGALTGDTRSTPLLLKFLTSPQTDIHVQTEIVWALGKAPDFSAYQPLAELEQRIWQTSSKDADLQKLRAAVDWSIREVRQGGHTDDY